MIEIIKVGNIPPETKFKVECNRCKSELKYISKDLSYMSGEMCLQCPVCGFFIDHYEDNEIED